MHCSNALGKNAFPTAVQDRLTASLWRHCKYSYAGLLGTQVCSDPTPMHCSNALGKHALLLLNAALQDRLTASL